MIAPRVDRRMAKLGCHYRVHRERSDDTKGTRAAIGLLGAAHCRGPGRADGARRTVVADCRPIRLERGCQSRCHELAERHTRRQRHTCGELDDGCGS